MQKFILNEKTNNYVVTNELTKDDILQMAFSIAENSLTNDIITTVEAAEVFIRAKLMMHDREVFGMISLTNQHEVITNTELFEGTISSCSVHPREIVKQALLDQSNAVVIYHNHPGGNSEPSLADIAITKRIKTALSYVDIRVLDHVIVSKSGIVSFAQRGLL